MFSLFRKVRKRLIQQDQARKYFIYAFGEILLIIIGVLIALSVAEWNNTKKERAKERLALLEIRRALRMDLKDLKELVVDVEVRVNRLNKLEKLLKDPAYPYSPEMDSLFGALLGNLYQVNETAYFEDLKAKGLEMVIDKDLRRQLIAVFEEGHRYMLEIRNNEKEIEQMYTGQYVLNNFHSITLTHAATPIAYKKIWMDPYFRNLVKLRGTALEDNQLEYYPFMIKKMRKLLALIEEYLNIPHRPEK